MEEIIITEDGKIKCDFASVKKELEESLNQFKGIVFTEDTKNDAKKTVAQLRKDKAEYVSRVKDAKKKWMLPWESFEQEAYEVINLYDKPIIEIDTQIKDFETKRIEEKKSEIKEYYDELVEEDLRDLLPLRKIYNPKWENATYKAKDIRCEIIDKKVEVKKALESIKSFHSDVEKRALDTYALSYNLTDALNVITSFEEQKKQILEKTKAEAEERIRREERAKIEAEMKAAEKAEEAKEEGRQEVINTLLPKAEEDEPENVFVYNIFLTDKQKEALDVYLDTAGITYKVRGM